MKQFKSEHYIFNYRAGTKADRILRRSQPARRLASSIFALF